MTELTADAVDKIAMKVLYKPEEVPDRKAPPDAVMVEGLMRMFAFHPARIREAKPEIDALLAELPDQFFHDKGGGWSFLNLCMDRHNNQWGEHRSMEALVCLGIGVGSASWQLKDMADALPGGMPYVIINLQHEGVK